MASLHAGHSTSLACPYCGHPLTWTTGDWLPAFECDQCGRFPDFGSAAFHRRDDHSRQDDPAARAQPHLPDPEVDPPGS